MKLLMKFIREKFLLALALLMIIIGMFPVTTELATIGAADPKYDLLFSIDYNDVPYSDPGSAGIIIRVKNRRASAIFSGNWQQGMSPYLPALYICEAAKGDIREIPIPFAPPLTGGHPIPKNRHPVSISINVPELQSLTIDSSHTAPNGYTLSEINFNKTYNYSTLVDAFPYPFGAVLKNDAYKRCLLQIGNRSVGLTVHFIGWLTPAPTSEIDSERLPHIGHD
jgi:hypothetical protein